MSEKIAKGIACVSGFVGFGLIFGTAGKLEYASLANEVFTLQDALLQLLWGVIIMGPAVVYLMFENRR